MDAAWTAYWTLKRHWLQNSTSELKTSSVSLLDLPQRTSAKPTHRQSGIAGTAKIDFTRPLDTSVVRGKTAIVFDAAKGLGNGIAAELARNGAYVAVCDPDEEAGSKAVSQLNDEGCLTKFFKTDTSSWESQGEAFRQILVWSGGQLDIVVTVPGIVTNNLMMSILPKHHLPGNTPTKPPTRVLEVDLIGVYYSATLALFYFNQIHADKPDMDFRPQLVFIGSMASYDGLDFGSDYAAAKHGVRAIWRTTRKPRPSMAQWQSNLLAPTYVSKNNMHTRSEGELKDHHLKVNEISDVVAGAMRCICDPAIEGRSMACVQGSVGTPGQLNFDLCDDIGDFNGGLVLHDKVDDIFMPSRTNLSEDANCKVQ